LFITGEAEYAEQSAGPLILTIGKFLKNINAPAWFYEFGCEDGWAASHCQIGAQQALQELVYDWLDKVLINPEKMENQEVKLHNFSKVISYFGKIPEVKRILSDIRIQSF
jgi:hypothetical protein